MPELQNHPLSVAPLWFAAMFALLALAILLVRRWRDGSGRDRHEASKMLSKFRELHARGGLSDHEYRTIKTKLRASLEAELNDNDQTS